MKSVGLVGCGYVAGEHIRAWRRLGGCRVVAVCDTNEERAATMARTWGIASYYSKLEEMLEHEEIQFLSVCTPAQAHTELVCRALRSGVNVVVEKPLAMSVRDIEAIGNVLRQSRARLTVIHNWLFQPVILRIGRILGKLHEETISADMQVLCTPNDLMAKDPGHWCHTLPGGRFGEMLTHPIYVLRRFLGDLKVTGFYAAKIGPYRWMRYDELRVLLSSPEKRASLYVSFNSPQYSILLDLYGKTTIIRAELVRNELLVFRDRGTHTLINGTIDNARQLVEIIHNALGNISYALSPFSRTAHEICIRSLVDSGASEEPPAVTLEDAQGAEQLVEDITTLIDKRVTEKDAYAIPRRYETPGLDQQDSGRT